MFKRLTHHDGQVTVLAQNDFAARYFYPPKWYTLIKRLAPGLLWRFKQYAGVSGWQLQQPVKLSVPTMADHDQGVCIILDSDVVFLRSFDDASFGVGHSEKRILLRLRQDMHRKHMETAWRLLNRPIGNPGYHYTTMPMIMYSDWVAQLQTYLEEIHQKAWQKVLYEAGPIHEDCLYGIFVEEVLQPTNLMIQETPLSYMVWDDDSLSRFMSGNWSLMTHDGAAEPICVVLQSNLGIEASEYRTLMEGFWNSTKP